MAEVAAGALAAEQAVSTTLEAGAVAGVAIAQPTVPLKASFERIGSAPVSEAPDSLSRSHHTVTYVKHDLYIYGGLVGKTTLAGPEMHILRLGGPPTTDQPMSPGAGQTSYKTVPPLSAAGAEGPLPSARFGHTAVAMTDGQHEGKIAVFGGSKGAKDSALDEEGRVWLFDPETLHWTHLDPSPGSTEHPGARTGHTAVSAPGSSMIIHGGKNASDAESNDTWRFDFTHGVWSRLPALPTSETGPESNQELHSSDPPALAIAYETLYLITTSTDNLSMNLNTLDLAALTKVQEQQGDPPSDFSSATWSTTTIPTNPLTASPSLKCSGASFLPISTGLGRTYLLHMMGAKGDMYSSAVHALQLPSPSNTPASVKDTARDNVPRADSHRLEWHAVEITPKEEGSGNGTWLQTFENHQANVRTTVGNAASAAGEWIKGRARAVSEAAKDLHIGGVDQPEPEAVPESERKKGPIMEDQEVASGMQELSLKSPRPETGHSHDENVKGAEASTEAKEVDKDDLPLSSQVPHHIKPGTEANAASGLVSGKAHPGPRAWFGSAVLHEPTVGTVGTGERPSRVVMWGGLNAKDEREGDGWVVSLRV